MIMVKQITWAIIFQNLHNIFKNNKEWKKDEVIKTSKLSWFVGCGCVACG